MDEIAGPIRRCGTFTPQKPPEEYLSTDAIGWIKTGKRNRVEVTVSERLAHTAVSRIWQKAQECVVNSDGTRTLIFFVGEVDEVIRWSLGFGAEAWISGPQDAVLRARAVVEDIVHRYD
jgi:hypothetical protein